MLSFIYISKKVKKMGKQIIRQLNSRVPEALYQRFWDTKPQGMLGYHIMTAAAAFWCELPSECRERILFSPIPQDEIEKLVRKLRS